MNPPHLEFIEDNEKKMAGSEDNDPLEYLPPTNEAYDRVKSYSTKRLFYLLDMLETDKKLFKETTTEYKLLKWCVETELVSRDNQKNYNI